MTIDFHTHCFPDALAVKAVSRLSAVSGGLTPYTDGTLAGLRRSMVEGGVSASVVMHIATNPTQQKKVGAMLGDFVEVGCNSVLNPGTVIGRNAAVYPLSCVRGTIPENSIHKNNGTIVQKY